MDKKLLETQTLHLIEAASAKEDGTLINLVKFARKNDLFFPELYELWYVHKVNQSVVSGKSFFHEGCHQDFGIDTPQAGKIFAEAFQISIIELRGVTGPGGGITRYFENILKSGLFFDEGFWQNNYMAKNLSNDKVPALRDINSSNYATWLQGQLADKPKIKQKKI